jgi:hypothetical protein
MFAMVYRILQITMNKKYVTWKRCLFAAALCIGAVWRANAQTEVYDLYFAYRDSAVVSLDLANLRSLTFSYSDRTMTAHYHNGDSDTYDYTQLGLMYFTEATNGVESMEYDDAELYMVQGRVLTLHDGAEQVVLYRLDGVPVMEITSRAVSLQGVQPGIYVLRVDNQMTKLCVK